jgi:hypothetical protein
MISIDYAVFPGAGRARPRQASVTYDLISRTAR